MSLGDGSVNAYLQRARMAGLRWPLPDGLDDAALERLLSPPAAAPKAARARPRPDWAALDKEMRRKGVTLALLWEEHRAAHPDGFGDSWFCEQYGAFKSRLRPPMRQSYAAGEKGLVDFAGDTIDVVDPSTGEARPRKPRDKAKVEPSVLIAERSILARLRNRRFFSAADLNVAIAERVGDIDARVMKGYDASRVELFTAIDKPALKSLPGQQGDRVKRHGLARSLNARPPGAPLLRRPTRRAACLESLGVRLPDRR